MPWLACLRKQRNVFPTGKKLWRGSERPNETHAPMIHLEKECIKHNKHFSLGKNEETLFEQRHARGMKRTVRLLPHQRHWVPLSSASCCGKAGARAGGALFRSATMTKTTTLRGGSAARKGPFRRLVGTSSQEGAGATASAPPLPPPPSGWQLHRTGGVIGSAMGFFGGLVGQGIPSVRFQTDDGL
jgi:hypothetical protein